VNEQGPDDLDRRIDLALRRRFELPAGIDTFAARVRPRAHRPWLLLAAAAAAAAALVLAFAYRDARAPAAPPAGAPVVVERDAALGPATLAEPLACRLVGPLVDGAPDPGRLVSPDLAALWRDMDACQRSAAAAACGDDALNERLRATYGDEIALLPEADGLLHGPFGSREWPTGTILTSTSDELTSVVIAERETTLACCMEVELAESSGLRLFHWQVGDVVLTEITPHPEPRLLAYFE
jgi:hypothetical protein